MAEAADYERLMGGKTFYFIPTSSPEDFQRFGGQAKFTALVEANGFNVYIPEGTDKIQYGGWHPFPPEERGKMLHDAISTAPPDSVIYIPGGFDGTEVIAELERLGPLPERPDLKVFGFSDAAKIFRYLGQKGVARTYIYSGGQDKLITEGLDQLPGGNAKIDFDVQDLHVPDRLKDGITDGLIHPVIGYEGSLYKCKGVDSQSRLCAPPVENIMLEELYSTGDNGESRIEDVIRSLQHPAFEGKNVTIMLSSNTANDRAANLVTRLKENGLGDVGVYKGAPWWHNPKDKANDQDPRPLPMYARTDIKDGRCIITNSIHEGALKEVKEAPFVKDEKREWPKDDKGKDLPATSLVKYSEYRSSNTGFIYIEDFDRIAPDKDGALTVDLSSVSSWTGLHLKPVIERLVDEGQISPDDIKKINYFVKDDKVMETIRVINKDGKFEEKIDSGQAVKEFGEHMQSLFKYTLNKEVPIEKVPYKEGDGKFHGASNCAQCGVNTTRGDCCGSHNEGGLSNRIAKGFNNMLKFLRGGWSK